MGLFSKERDRASIAETMIGGTYRITNVQGCTMIKGKGEWFRYMSDVPLSHGDRVRVTGQVKEILQVEPA